MGWKQRFHSTIHNYQLLMGLKWKSEFVKRREPAYFSWYEVNFAPSDAGNGISSIVYIPSSTRILFYIDIALKCINIFVRMQKYSMRINKCMHRCHTRHAPHVPLLTFATKHNNNSSFLGMKPWTSDSRRFCWVSTGIFVCGDSRANGNMKRKNTARNSTYDVPTWMCAIWKPKLCIQILALRLNVFATARAGVITRKLRWICFHLAVENPYIMR